MDKAAVIERYKALLNQLDEPALNVILTAGSALVMHGIRETTSDLDADVKENVFNLHKRSGKYETKDALPGIGELLVYDKDVELHVFEETRGLSYVDGVWCYSPHELLIQKRYLSTMPGRSENKRAADMLDIIGLEALIKQRSKHSARVMA